MGNPNNVNLKREVGNTALIIFLTPLKQQNLNFVNHNQPSNANCLKGDTGYRWRGWKRFFPDKQSTFELYFPIKVGIQELFSKQSTLDRIISQTKYT